MPSGKQCSKQKEQQVFETQIEKEYALSTVTKDGKVRDLGREEAETCEVD